MRRTETVMTYDQWERRFKRQVKRYVKRKLNRSIYVSGYVLPDYNAYLDVYRLHLERVLKYIPSGTWKGNRHEKTCM